MSALQTIRNIHRNHVPHNDYTALGNDISRSDSNAVSVNGADNCVSRQRIAHFKETILNMSLKLSVLIRF